MADAAEEIGSFFDYIWQTTDGFVYVPEINMGAIKKAMFKWPERREAVINHVLRISAEGGDAFFSPALFRERGNPVKENVLGSHVLWADFDGGSAPDTFVGIPDPTLRVQSSVTGNEHTYWLLDSFLTDVKGLEDRNRAIAYGYKADTGGWDAVQFLRPPATVNSGIKRGTERVRPPSTVTRLSDFGDPLNITALDSLPTAKFLIAEGLSRPENIPKWQDVIALNSWSKEMWDLFNTKKEDLSDRSGALLKLAGMGADKGFDDASIYAIIDRADTKWEKYLGRRDRDKHLLDLINRVRLKAVVTNDQYADMLSGFEDDIKEEPKPLFFSFMDFINADFHMEWLMGDLLPVGGYGMFSATPGAGKTQLAIQLAAKVALGQDFLKWPNSSGVPKKVLFLSLEMAGPPLHKFMTTMLPAYDDVERAVLQENLVVAPLGSAIYLDMPAGQQYLQSVLAKIRPDLLIIDSMQKITSKALTDETAIKEFNAFLQRRIRAEYNCAVIVIHHNRKGDRDNPRATPTQDDILGHTLIAAELDFALSLRKLTGTNILTLANVKNRMAQETPPFDITRQSTLTFVVTEGAQNVHTHITRSSGHDSGNPPQSDSPIDPSQFDFDL